MFHVAPSSSVYASALDLTNNCETKVRLVRCGPASLSVNRIGSRLRNEVVGALTSSHVAGAGDPTSSHFTRNVCRPETNMALPEFQLTPIVGSPAELPSSGGAG